MGTEYYVVYYDGTKRISKDGIQYPVRHEKRVGLNLADAWYFKVEKQREIKSGKAALLQEQQEMTFKMLVDRCKKEEVVKTFVLDAIGLSKDFFGRMKLSDITRRDFEAKLALD